MSEAFKGLQFVSNVIELKHDKQYIFVFKGDISFEQIMQMGGDMSKAGFHGFAIILQDGQDMQVIEAPKKEEGNL